MNELKKELQDYGLSVKEAEIYLCLLSIGQSTANEVAERADLIRTTTYDVLKKLKEKCLVSCVIKNKVRYFEAAEPTKLIQIVQDKKNRIEKILPELNNLSVDKIEKPILELYEGKEGIKNIYQDILDKKESISAFSNTHFLFKILPFYVPNFIKERKKRNIQIRLLTEETKETQWLMKDRDKKELRETRFINKFDNLPITQYIYGDNVAIFGTSTENPLSIIIRHKDFANAQRSIFGIIWDNSK